MIPLGFAVVPDVYSKYRRSSLSIGSGGHSGAAALDAMRSWYQWSRPSVIDTSEPVRRTTTTWSTVGVLASAVSTLGFNRLAAPRRYPPSAVMTTLHSASLMRSMSE